jgi:uncharacterized protein with PIN domain
VGAGLTFRLVVAGELRTLLPTRRRSRLVDGGIDLDADGVSTIGHVVGSLGIPLTEVGGLRSDGRKVSTSWRPHPGAVVEVSARPRPQQTPTTPPAFLLDVHLGTLARRLRLLGIDAAWSNDATDAEIVQQAQQQQRVILTRDRGLLLRRAAREGAYVRGNDPDDQLADVLDRFDPLLRPWTRCPACNGMLVPVEKSAVVDRLEPGTRRMFDSFAACPDCGRVYWAGAHHQALQRIVERSEGGDASDP